MSISNNWNKCSTQILNELNPIPGEIKHKYEINAIVILSIILQEKQWT